MSVAKINPAIKRERNGRLQGSSGETDPPITPITHDHTDGESMSTTKVDETGPRPIPRKLRREQLAANGALTMAEYLKARQNLLERMVQLRAARLRLASSEAKKNGNHRRQSGR